MTTSDSEDFESADEGHTQFEKKERKKRTSSSNHSESEVGPKEIVKSDNKDQKLEPASEKKADGWDDFDIDTPKEDDKPEKSSKETKPAVTVTTTVKTEVITKKDEVNTQDTGWDDFDDWGQDVDNDAAKMPSLKPLQSAQTDADIKVVTEKLAEASTKSNAWGWGWGMDSLLSTATAGITTLTSQVSQSISTVLETSIGAPDPEELARRNTKESEIKDINVKSSGKVNPDTTPAKVEQPNSNEASFQFGSLFSGVTKFVESTGTKVIAGGLDTLETIGKKTMEVLQDGDPGLVKKRAMLGLDAGEKPVLSQILREAKAKADEEDKIKEEKREAKEVHYENLFDDFEGLVHLEALEMLSKQVSMRIEERLREVDPEKRQDIKETLQQVQELCEIPEDEDEDGDPPSDQPKPDALHERLQVATQDLGLKLQFQPLVKQYTDVLTWLSSEDIVTDKAIYKRAVSSLAQATALAVEVYHKTAEMLLVKTRRSTADEADALTQMTVVLTKHVSELATLFTVKLNSLAADNKDQINNYITNIFLESGNSSTYIQNAFQLALPILQVGAV